MLESSSSIVVGRITVKAISHGFTTGLSPPTSERLSETRVLMSQQSAVKGGSSSLCKWLLEKIEPLIVTRHINSQAMDLPGGCRSPSAEGGVLLDIQPAV